MAKKKNNGEVKATDYRHTGEKRTNIPPAKIAAEGKVPVVPKVRYHYSPHLPPVLQFDSTGKADKLPHLLAESGKRPLTPEEQRVLADALRTHQPWLEWAGKSERYSRRFFDVEPVALHIHERVSAQATIRTLTRMDVQRDLFADPQQTYAQAVQFYKHSVDWANRLILGDSLEVMTSLAKREQLAGKVQMIYVDPPYGIRYASNFQPLIGSPRVKDQDADLTREPESVRAYRDTWHLGRHSYLQYLFERLQAAKELLSTSGSIFVQIGDDNVHLVRNLMDEVLGAENFVAVICFRTTGGLGRKGIKTVFDLLIWYARDKGSMKFRPLFRTKVTGEDSMFRYRRTSNGEIRPLDDTDGYTSGDQSAMRFADLVSSGLTPSCVFDVSFEGRLFSPGRGCSWKTNPSGMERLKGAERLAAPARTLQYLAFHDDHPVSALTNMWDDTVGELKKRYAVQTSTAVIERCVLMTTDPGDLVLDPTCGSGTTAFVAEKWGRRWITTDSSRVAIAIARQRILTAQFDHYKTRSTAKTGQAEDPGTGFVYATVPHVSLGAIAQNHDLDPILEKHTRVLADRLEATNAALAKVSKEERSAIAGKLAAKERRDGRRSITESDRRRWLLPDTAWKEWQVPFDVDPDWPPSLRRCVEAFRDAWRAKMTEVNACIAANARMEQLVDKPEIIAGVVRVSGPFSVEGVRPEELSIDGQTIFDPTPNEFEADGEQPFSDTENLQSYLSHMVAHLRTDGVTFLGNQNRKFANLDELFQDASGSLIHAEGMWDGQGENRTSVAVSIGPQHGPVTALQVEEAIREAKRYDEIVLAGFSFDAEAFAVAHEQSHPRLRVHLAHIRPDLNEAMAGLLKDTPNSELFAVFGQPEIDLRETNDGWICTLKGVDIYNPLDNTVRSSGADKVAAWFLDSDFDGRCFCITQAFFPNQNAWEKIARALGNSADAEAFEKLRGTTSLPFSRGKFNRIAVKVIDPRGNEVMAIRKLG